MEPPRHTPVMAAEAIEWIAAGPGKVIVDCTAGLGGHTKLIAGAVGESGRVIALDRDAQSLEMARRNVGELESRIRFHHGEFSNLRAALDAAGVESVDAVLADLGTSVYQLTDPERGLSILADGPLDMRLDQSTGQTAADLVNQCAETALADLIYEFGEERRARKLARAIVRGRPFRSTRELAACVESVLPRTGKLHPATRVFMALRIAVNGEMEELDALLDIAPRMIRPGGRFVVIAFHSLEDRKVKHSFRALEQAGVATVLTKHPLVAGEEEVRRNPPSRSAKLRALEMTPRINKKKQKYSERG